VAQAQVRQCRRLKLLIDVLADSWCSMNDNEAGNTSMVLMGQHNLCKGLVMPTIKADMGQVRAACLQPSCNCLAATGAQALPNLQG
jgi:hypothetical protein